MCSTSSCSLELLSSSQQRGLLYFGHTAEVDGGHGNQLLVSCSGIINSMLLLAGSIDGKIVLSWRSS